MTAFGKGLQRLLAMLKDDAPAVAKEARGPVSPQAQASWGAMSALPLAGSDRTGFSYPAALGSDLAKAAYEKAHGKFPGMAAVNPLFPGIGKQFAAPLALAGGAAAAGAFSGDDADASPLSSWLRRGLKDDASGAIAAKMQAAALGKPTPFPAMIHTDDTGSLRKAFFNSQADAETWAQQHMEHVGSVSNAPNDMHVVNLRNGSNVKPSSKPGDELRRQTPGGMANMFAPLGVGATGAGIAAGALNGDDANASPLTPWLKRALKDAPLLGYHASPHAFDRFDLSKVGSGEGSQAFGHGLYFADDEGTTNWYKSLFESRGQDAHRYKAALDVDPATMADMDQPLSVQPRTVQDAFADVYGLPRKALMSGQKPLPKGPAESAMLADRGVPGAVYDAGTFWGGENPGSRNYVMFDDKPISILKRYAVPGAIAAGGAAALSDPEQADASPLDWLRRAKLGANDRGVWSRLRGGLESESTGLQTIAPPVRRLGQYQGPHANELGPRSVHGDPLDDYPIDPAPKASDRAASLWNVDNPIIKAALLTGMTGAGAAVLSPPPASATGLDRLRQLAGDAWSDASADPVGTALNVGAAPAQGFADAMGSASKGNFWDLASFADPTMTGVDTIRDIKNNPGEWARGLADTIDGVTGYRNDPHGLAAALLKLKQGR